MSSTTMNCVQSSGNPEQTKMTVLSEGANVQFANIARRMELDACRLTVARQLAEQLFLGTAAGNTADMIAKGRGRQSLRPISPDKPRSLTLTEAGRGACRKASR